jgi:catechol 2,3-dioxygenase-like lactoylglutathione lyase family enzyme
MNDIDTRFLRATPVLRVADYPVARAYWVDVLGFRIVEEGGDPPRFGILERDRAVVFLDAWHGGRPPRETGWDAYLHVRGLTALHAEFAAAGANVVRPVEGTIYGMLEFEILDPDGNRVCFGEDPEGTD